MIQTSLTSPALEPRYAVRHCTRSTFIVMDPTTQILEVGVSVSDHLAPMTWTLTEAQAVAELFATRDCEGLAPKWTLVLVPNPCAGCGRVIDVDDGDFCYPENRDRTKWRAGCNEHDFGCGYEVTAATRDEALAKWNAGL